MELMSTTLLGKRFGKRWIFRGVEISLRAGESLAVLGHNGSGKTTLLKILSGLTSPSEGGVRRGVIGYSALDLALWPQLTGGEHVRLADRLRGTTSPHDLLDQYGLGEAISQPVKEYSTGMRARLKLALATMHRPEVLILDEPTASMDDEGRALVARLVSSQLKHGAVVLATNESADRRLATHEISLG